MKRMLVVVLATLAAGSSFSQAPPPTPAPTATSRAPHLLGLGFGVTPSATPSPV